MKKLTVALLLCSLGATFALFADASGDSLVTGNSLTQTTRSNENIQLADWGWWSRSERREEWCERHPKECHREWCEHHPGACGETWCERHPVACRERWCESHPRECH